MKKVLISLILAFVFYLFQVTLLPYLPIFNIVGNIILAYVAVLAVSLGMYFAFIAGALSGILMEITLAPYDMLNLLLYPILSIIGAFALSDKSNKKETSRINTGKLPVKISPYIRIPLCAALMAFIREVISQVYIYLAGFDITFQHVIRSIVAIAYTSFLAILLMFPIRFMLGIRQRKAKATTTPEEI